MTLRLLSARSRPRPLALAVVLLLLPVSALGAQGTVVGRVVDEGGEPIFAARVSVPRLERATIATSSGSFTIGRLAAGRHEIHAAQLGFAPGRVPVLVVAGDTARVTIVLARSAIALAAVQVTATVAASEPRAVAQSTATLEGGALEQRMAATVGATLAAQPGMAARTQGPGASAPVIRGLSGDRIVVLQDGQRTGDLASTAPDHGVTVDPASARRIEVVRGPAALLHGNNAIGGVVNIISDDIPSVVPPSITGSATLAAESASPGGAVLVEGSMRVGSRTALTVRGGARSHGDLRLGRGAETSVLDGSHVRSHLASAGVAHEAAWGTVGGAFRGYGFEYGLPASGGLHLRGERREALVRAELRPSGTIAEGVRIEGGGQWYAHDEIAADGSVPTALGLRSASVRALARTRPLGPFRDGAFGVSALMRRNDVTGTGALTPANSSAGLGIFALQELPVGPVRIPVGVRVDRYVLRSEESERFGAGRQRRFAGLSGSIGLVVPLADGVTAAANVARAFRSPTAEELFSEAGHAGTGAFEIGDPDLAAERGTGVDAVLRVERRRVTATISAYRNDIGDYIALRPTGRDTVVADGAGGQKSLPLHIVSQRDASLWGLEGSAELVLRERWVVGVMGDLVRARDALGEPLPFLPPPRLGVAARFDDGRVRAGVETRHVFTQGRVPVGELRTGAHTLVDAHAGVRLPIAGRSHSITVRAENLGDRLYRDAASRIKHLAPAGGRNVAVVYRVGGW